MVRSPRVRLVCAAVARAERRHGRPSFAQRRADGRALRDPVSLRIDDGLAVTAHTIEVDGRAVPAWLYRAPGPEPRPVHVLLHAGAFCYGSAAEVDAIARRYALGASCAVLTLDYRLAPEHPWPAAPEDAYAALGWLVEHAASLRVDPTRLSIGGISAGGAVAATAALLARDRGGPALAFQLLEIPVLDLTLGCPSLASYATGYLLTRAELADAYAAYVPDPAHRRAASPLLADDLYGLPPTFVLTAEHDPLRDEGERYAGRLRESGVPTQLVRARGHVHSSTYADSRSARHYQRLTVAALTRGYTVSQRV